MRYLFTSYLVLFFSNLLACHCAFLNELSIADVEKTDYIAHIRIKEILPVKIESPKYEGQDIFFKIVIEEITHYKGKHLTELIIEGGHPKFNTWTSCDFNMHENDEWVIFSEFYKDVPFVYPCWRTTKFQHANGLQDWRNVDGKKYITFLDSLFTKNNNNDQKPAGVVTINDEQSFFTGEYDKSYIRKNSIKQVMVDGYIEKKLNSKAIYHFDKAGILEKMSIIDSNEMEKDIFGFKFNEQGHQIMRITYANGINRADTVTIYKEYKDNRLVKDSTSWLPISTHYIYDDQGKLIKTSNPYFQGHMHHDERVVRYEYTKTGQLIHVTDCIFMAGTDTIEQWMSDRTLIYKDNKIIKVIEKIPNGYIPTNKGNLDYSYDQYGNLVSFDSDAVTSYFYEYADKGLLGQKREKMIHELKKIPEDPDDINNIISMKKYSYSFWE